jgi:hypothetical protein
MGAAIRKFLKRKKEIDNTFLSVSDLIESASNPETGWGSYYYGNVSALASLLKVDSVTEVGVAYGGHAHFILKNNPEIHYVGVDPYEFGYDANDAFCSDVEKYLGLKGQSALDKLHEGVSASLQRFPGRATLIRTDSITYADSLDLESHNLVFLDDNHTYEYVSKELKSWWPKIKQGGVLCGDDYWMSDVSKAVDEFVQFNKLKLFFIGKVTTKLGLFTKISFHVRKIKFNQGTTKGWLISRIKI